MSWGLLTKNDAQSLEVWADGLAVDFGIFGLWNYKVVPWISWSVLTTSNAQDLEGWAASLAADFNGSGLWNYDRSAWSLLTNWDAEDMISVEGIQYFQVWTVDGMQRVTPHAPAEIGTSIELFAVRG